MSFTIDENMIVVQNCSPAYTVTPVNLDISAEPLSPLPPESYTISGTAVIASQGAEPEDPGFGTHIREAVEIVRDWTK